MTDKDKEPLVQEDEQKLEHLDKEIQEARQHLKEQTHDGELEFIEEGTEDTKDVDNNIAPPG